jgi:hypothetical protein
MHEPKVTSLSEKAMLVKLTTRRANLTKRDLVAEAIIQSQMDDASLVVNSKLFRDKDNPINSILSALNDVYTYHKTHTLPYIDKGPRILPNLMYMEYTQAIRQKISVVDNLLTRYMPDYDRYVQLDIQYRSANTNQSRAKVEDYPTVDEFRAKTGIELRFQPLPDKKHFLFDLSDADVANFSQAMLDAERTAKHDVIGRMLKPLTHLVEKLNKPIGADGAVFRDSAVQNVVEGIETAKKLMVDDDPSIRSVIDELNQAVSKFAGNEDWLRESPVVREQAAKKLDEIARQMGVFMGA